MKQPILCLTFKRRKRGGTEGCVVRLNLWTFDTRTSRGVKWNLIGFFNLKLKLWRNQNETFSTCSPIRNTSFNIKWMTSFLTVLQNRLCKLKFKIDNYVFYNICSNFHFFTLFLITYLFEAVKHVFFLLQEN